MRLLMLAPGLGHHPTERGEAPYGTGHPGMQVQPRTGQVRGSGRQMTGKGHGGKANGRDGL